MTLTMVDPGPSVIKNVCEAVKCVVVIISGRPIVIEPYLSSIDALVAAWLPGTEGQGVTDVLFGDYGFSGKLPRTWFRTTDQLPMTVEDSHYDPLFPLGFGVPTESVKDLVERYIPIQYSCFNKCLMIMAKKKKLGNLSYLASLFCLVPWLNFFSFGFFLR
jgi:beta-glucosidase